MSEGEICVAVITLCCFSHAGMLLVHTHLTHLHLEHNALVHRQKLLIEIVFSVIYYLVHMIVE